MGCEACLCSVLGSLGPACDPASGQCSCRPGYTGHKCNICPGGHAQKFGKSCHILYCTTCVVDPDQIIPKDVVDTDPEYSRIKHQRDRFFIQKASDIDTILNVNSQVRLYFSVVIL